MAGEWQGINQEEPNGRLFVEFSMKPEKDEAASLEAGRPIFKEIEWIKIRVPGDPNNNISRAVRFGDADRFPREYQAFKSKATQPIEGTLLEDVKFLTAAQVMEFQAIGCRTAEQFINMPDALGQKIMGFQDIKRKMTRYIDAAKSSASAQKLADELQKRDERISALEAMLAKKGELNLKQA